MRFLNQCVDPGAQLIEGERFDHVVIRPELKQITISYQPANGPNDCSLNSDGIPFCVEVIVVSGGVAKLVEECMTCNASRGREGRACCVGGPSTVNRGTFDPPTAKTISDSVGWHTANIVRPIVYTHNTVARGDEEPEAS